MAVIAGPTGRSSDDGLEIAILGPLEPRSDGAVLRVPAGKQRALLCLLVVRAPHPVAAEAAAEALWPEAPPGRGDAQPAGDGLAAAALARAGRGAGGDAGVRLSPGGRGRRDRRAALRGARRARARGARARRRGGSAPPRRRARAVARARAGRCGVRGVRAGGDRAAGGAAPRRARGAPRRCGWPPARRRWSSASSSSLAPSIRRASGWSRLLMLALYRCGRQADALEAYTRARRRLDEELGLEPSAELQRLQGAILRQDASLAAPGAGEPPPEGVVTMLFTDIEGSTRMARAAGAAWPDALAIHHELVAGAVEDAGGHRRRQRGRRAVRVLRRPGRGGRGGGGRPGGVARAGMARRGGRAACPDGDPHGAGRPFRDGLRRARGAPRRAHRRGRARRPGRRLRRDARAAGRRGSSWPTRESIG